MGDRTFGFGEVIDLTGVPRAQLIYWTQAGLITTAVREARGTGHHRVFSFRSLVEVAVAAALAQYRMSVRTIGFVLRAIGDPTHRAGRDRATVAFVMGSPGPAPATPKQGRTCGARRAHGRGTCQSTAVMRDGRCRLHGGAPPSGPASPHWASGVHSPILNSLPATLAAQCATALATDRLTDLREEAALIDTMIHVEVRAWKSGAPSTGGLAAQTALRRMTEAMAAGDVRTVRRQITTPSDLFAPGASGERAQQRIAELEMAEILDDDDLLRRLRTGSRQARKRQGTVVA